MNKTTCKIIGCVKKVRREHIKYNHLFNSGAFEDDGFYNYWERRLENISDWAYQQVCELNKQLGKDALENPSDWFKREVA